MQRYSISVVGKLAYEIDGAETPSGDWCRAQDVVALEAHVAELETAVAALKALAESLQERLAAAEAYIDALLRMQAAVRVVADESEGIAGWHQNGELAKWDELLPEIFDEYADKSGERVMNNIDELWSEMVAKAKLSLDINWMVTEDEVLVKIAERLAAAESRIAELVSGIKEAQIELIETGKIYALGLSCQKRLVTELEEALSAAEAMNKKLAKFFVGAIQCSFDGCDYGGDEIQDYALALGLIEECTPPDDEEGPWYRIVDDVKKLIEGE